MKKLRVLIVDDESLARDALRVELAALPEAEIAGECAGGAAAVQAIQELEPDLVFLDVQMPEMNGFEVVRRVGVEHMPPVIFVTAFDRYALKAFEVHALDYLLKPFDTARLMAAWRRARRLIEDRRAGVLHRKLVDLLGEHFETAGAAAAAYPERLEIKLAGRTYLLRVDDIDWIEAANSYVRIHSGKNIHLLRASISAMEQKLDPARFVRIHRSAIVNVASVREFSPIDHGDYEVVLGSGHKLRASRGRRDALLAKLRD